MRPSVDEQLHGTCRILEEVVAPAVADPYARTILAGLIANLRMLHQAIPAVAAFLQHDNQACAQLLAELAPALPPPLAEAIVQALAHSEPEPTDSAALEQRNQALRELLAQAVCGEALAPDLQAKIKRHMIERASRMPMRYVPTAPTTS
jgi:hypothetical protein